MIQSRATRQTYLKVFVELAVLTAIEVAIAFFTFNETLRIIILLGLAAAKAGLVALYYMHLKYDNRILSIIGGFPLLLVVIMLIIFMFDQMTRR